MKKSFFTLLLVTLFLGGLQANPVDVNRAKALGIKFMNTNTEIKSATADWVYTAYIADNQACFYVFAVQPKGFVIVSADDRAKPILGYSTESNFTAQIPDGLMTLFDNYKAGFSQMYANTDERTEQAVADWKNLAETGKLSSHKTDRSVGPLLTSIWNQTDLYNNMAPEDPNSVYSGHCKSGCVANTMSQLMRYWEWQRTGEGSHSYYASSYYGNYGWQQADFGEAIYRFELMPDFLDFASCQAEVDATALLEYHAGVSVDMGYGPNASGAYSQDVPDALEYYFRYSPSMNLRDKDGYSLGAWENMIYENLDAGMPLYYSSSGPDGGHAYVLDGYDEFEMFHMNWGWAGFDNGYYQIEGFYLTFYSFPWYHSAIFNLHPNSEYYDAPKAVENLEASVLPEISLVELTFNPVYETRNGNPMSEIDAVYIMRDGVVIDSLLEVMDDQVDYLDEVEKGGTYYYTVYAVNEAGMSKVARDTVLVGSTCDVRFELSDSGNNGWDMSFIAVLDEDGKVSQRVGLWDGGSASLIVPVPNNQTATFFWTYDNTCYSHGSLSEVSYEIYDWDDNLIVASDGYPEVGEITSYDISCGMDCRPVYNLQGSYQWNNAEEYGVELTWEWDGDVVDFQQYAIVQNGMVVTTISNADQKSCFVVSDGPGTMNYGVVVYYEREGGESCHSEEISVSVEVTSVSENESLIEISPNPATDRITVTGKVKEVFVYNALGQMLRHSDTNSVEVSGLPEGIYFLGIKDNENAVVIRKFMKKD